MPSEEDDFDTCIDQAIQAIEVSEVADAVKIQVDQEHIGSGFTASECLEAC